MDRNCYCDIRDKDPDYFAKEGIPDGFCGICDRCQAPGHTQHFPGPVPMTGAWCDRCYKIVAIQYKLKRYGIPLLIIAAVLWFSR